jgi:hypothetical protein
LAAGCLDLPQNLLDASVAQGKPNYLAASGDRALMQRIIDRLLTEAEVPALNLSAGVRCRTRGKWRVYFNYGDTAANSAPASDETAACSAMPRSRRPASRWHCSPGPAERRNGGADLELAS